MNLLRMAFGTLFTKPGDFTYLNVSRSRFSLGRVA